MVCWDTGFVMEIGHSGIKQQLYIEIELSGIQLSPGCSLVFSPISKELVAGRRAKRAAEPVCV